LSLQELSFTSRSEQRRSERMLMNKDRVLPAAWNLKRVVLFMYRLDLHIDQSTLVIFLLLHSLFSELMRVMITRQLNQKDSESC
jgi:hypothetical protein